MAGPASDPPAGTPPAPDQGAPVIPDDADNRPQPGLHDNALAHWPLYPAFLREAFTRAFTRGLHAPLERVRESEWRALLARLADSLFYCGQCGAENFYDGEALRANGGAPAPAGPAADP